MKTAIIALTAAAGAAVLAAGPSQAAPPKDDCFLSNQWRGWSASKDGDALFLSVRGHDVYRIELTPGTHVRKAPDRFLVNKVRGSSWICSPLDLDLSLNDRFGYHEPLIARSIRKLTPAEAAALPKAERPG